MTRGEALAYARFLDLRVQGSQAQLDDRKAGKFGPDRATPEQLAWWSGRISGLQEAKEEMEMRLEVIPWAPLKAAKDIEPA